MKCCFCGEEAESVEEAIELGWYPDFWQGDVNWQGPVCPECQTEHLFTDADGEYVLKPDHPLPPLAVRMGFIEVRKETNMSENPIVKPKFSLGQTLATPGALKALEESGQSPGFFLDRHVHGDWGELGDEDKRLNDQALVDGSRILSAYRTLKGERLWIITEAADEQGRRVASTILRPSEY
jgi:hypothetical protein